MVNLEVSKVSTFSGHRDCVYTLEGFKAPAVFFSGAGDGMVVQWDLREGDKGTLIAKLDTSVYALHYYAPDNCLIIGQNYQGIHLLDIESRKEKGSLKLTDAAIFSIQTHGQLAFIGTAEGEVIVVALKALQIVARLQFGVKSARCITVHPNSRELVVGYSDNNIRIFDLDTYKLKKTIPAHKNSVFTVCFSPDFRFLLSAGRDAHLKIWDVGQDYNPVEDIVAHMYAINSICYSPDGRYFATCSMDKSIKIWDAAEFKLLKVIDKARHAGHGTSVNKLLWRDYENLLVSGSDDRSISIWDFSGL